MADASGRDALDPDLLGRYLAGDCSEAEAAALRRYCMAHPEAARALARFVAGLDAEAGRPLPPDAEAAWARLQARLHDAPADVGAAGPRLSAGPAIRAGRRAAMAATGDRGRRYAVHIASGALAAGTAVAAALLMPHHVAVAAHSYATAARERATVQLADGTTVRIAPGTRLQVAADYGDRRRDVYLDGEAYFDVVHDARRPFTVHARGATARDVGTAFAVRDYAADGAVQVVVRRGVVAFSGVGELVAGDVGRLTSGGAASLRHRADVEALLGWLQGRLVFHDAPLAQVAADLGRWSGVVVRFADPALGRLPFTGTLAPSDPGAAMAVAAATLGLAVHHDGHVLVVAAAAARAPPLRARWRTPRP